MKGGLPMVDCEYEEKTTQVRCPNCNKVLCDSYDSADNKVKIKCESCKKFWKISSKDKSIKLEEVPMNKRGILPRNPIILQVAVNE